MTEAIHHIVIENGSAILECHATSDTLCHAVYDCNCVEWFKSGVEDGVPWHETETFESWEKTERHFGRFDPSECSACDWAEGDPIECQVRGEDARLVIPVEVFWTGHGVEWYPSKGVSSQRSSSNVEEEK